MTTTLKNVQAGRAEVYVDGALAGHVETVRHLNSEGWWQGFDTSGEPVSKVPRVQRRHAINDVVEAFES